MSLTKFDKDRDNLFFPFNRMVDQFFNRDIFDNQNFASASLPAVNIQETEDDFQVELAAPGLKKEDFKIELDHNLLKISSQQKNKTEEKAENGTFTRREFSYQSFQRSFTLPNSVDYDKIIANYTHGILKISIPKREEAKAKTPRTISIQ